MRRISGLTWFALGLIALGAGLRVARHVGWLALPPNVAPVSALAMFSAVTLPRKYALVVPLGLMLLADAFIGFDILPITLSVYACFAVSYVLGQRLRARLSVGRMVVMSLVGSILFFLVTNAAVWQFGTMYARTWAGLGQSYLAGLPFFRNTVLGDLGYSGLFFGLYQLIVVYSKRATRSALESTHG